MGNISSMSFSTSLDESSLDATPASLRKNSKDSSSDSISESMLNLISLVSSRFLFLLLVNCLIRVSVTERELEIRTLRRHLDEIKTNNTALYQQLCSLRERENKLKKDLTLQKEQEKDMELKVFTLWQVPSWFIITDLNPSTDDFINE